MITGSKNLDTQRGCPGEQVPFYFNSIYETAGTSFSSKGSPSCFRAATLWLGILVKNVPTSPNKANIAAAIQVAVNAFNTAFLRDYIVCLVGPPARGVAVQALGEGRRGRPPNEARTGGSARRRASA